MVLAPIYGQIREANRLLLQMETQKIGAKKQLDILEKDIKLMKLRIEQLEMKVLDNDTNS